MPGSGHGLGFVLYSFSDHIHVKNKSDFQFYAGDTAKIYQT